MKVLVGYDKRYTVASLTILTDSIIQIFIDSLPEEQHIDKTDNSYDRGWTHGYNICRSELLERLGK